MDIISKLCLLYVAALNSLKFYLISPRMEDVKTFIGFILLLIVWDHGWHDLDASDHCNVSFGAIRRRRLHIGR